MLYTFFYTFNRTIQKNIFSRRGAEYAEKNNEFFACSIIAPALFYLRASRPNLRLCEKNAKQSLYSN